MSGIAWGSHARVRLAEALDARQLDKLVKALDTTEGIACVRAELERAREARPAAERGRAAVRQLSEGKSLRVLEAEADEMRGHVGLGYPGETAAGMERWRIICLMRATKWAVYQQSKDPGLYA